MGRQTARRAAPPAQAQPRRVRRWQLTGLALAP